MPARPRVGAAQCTMTPAFLATARTDVGAPGVPIVAITASDGADEPALFLAITVIL
jgi:hypothetical protein